MLDTTPYGEVELSRSAQGQFPLLENFLNQQGQCLEGLTISNVLGILAVASTAFLHRLEAMDSLKPAQIKLIYDLQLRDFIRFNVDSGEYHGEGFIFTPWSSKFSGIPGNICITEEDPQQYYLSSFIDSKGLTEAGKTIFRLAASQFPSSS